ncbi:MAG: hypothetical protein K2X81_01515 [Candidatus Obscuribacterales bacterium]|nr:hypothetical protein [Candidatus Obscuribacterales bacterium]
MTDLSIQIQELKQIQSQSQIRVIHYGCESWFNVKDRPVAVSCIVIVNLANHEQVSFSLTDYSDDNIEEREKKLLEDFYKNIRNVPDAAYLHWNMHSSEYGFAAIDKRYKFLNASDPPYRISEGRRFDLDSLITYKYGSDFADHPKLATLGTLNNFNKRYSLTGKEEADKFEAKEFGDIQRSTTEKAQLILFLAGKFLDGTLQTKHAGPRVRFANENVDAIQIILQIGNRFKIIGRQLKARHNARPTLEVNDEYDFQDLFHSLLRLFFDDVRAEEWAPSYAGGNSRTDFLIPAHSIAIELKHSRASMTAKDLGDQLLIDIAKYRQHPIVRIIVCLVFDPDGHISNPAGIESDLTNVKEGYSIVTKILT